MRRVGTIGGAVPLTAVDHLTLDVAWRHVFGESAPLDVDALPDERGRAVGGIARA